ncbi:hypothetical protein PMIN06_006684 [Paraphaeosphaeria minitans]|uniref:Uncharacterized protein n=1 Tax=Paraphaeosphaeria minitans TaxID=565426 RepID=A0A9P6KJ29_9PLEO|nr:hypothetical protein PMIN01_13631 [Paraphaeosphaeria minitans]
MPPTASSLAPNAMLLPCLVPSGDAPSGALPSCGAVVAMSSATKPPSSQPANSIITLAADPENPIVGMATSLDSSATPSSRAAQMPSAAPPPLDTAPTRSTLTTLASSRSHISIFSSTPPSAADLDPLSTPFADYLPGTPPVLIALYVVVLVWTLLFGYAMYHIYRADARPRRVAAHPQWRRQLNMHGQRSPKKAEGRFDMRRAGGRGGGAEIGGRIGRVGM